MYNRREILLGMGGALGLGLRSIEVAGASAASHPNGLGICTDSYWLRSRASQGSGEARFAEPLRFLTYCHDLGAGGIQAGIGRRDDAYSSRLRRQAQEYGMFVEGTAGLPRDQADLARFEAEVLTAKSAGATVIRVVMPSKGSGRRYEAFSSADEFREIRARGWRALELAEPVAARHRVRLAVENHKDERVGEKLETLKHIASEYVGVCVDTGNDLSFLEDPLEVIEAYAPLAFSSHLKDMAVQEYEEGFILAEVPLGEGVLDLPKAVEVLRGRHPEVQFSLEMMTRDPLKVPCLTERYWSAMGDIPGRNLARTLRMVRTRAPGRALPQVSRLSTSEQFELEEANVKKCLAYAHDHLGL